MASRNICILISSTIILQPAAYARILLNENENEGFIMAPPPLSVSIANNAKQSALKPIGVVILLLVLSTIATALIRVFCTRGGPSRPNTDEECKPRPDTEECRPKPEVEDGGGGQRFEFICCKGNIFTLFTWSA